MVISLPACAALPRAAASRLALEGEAAASSLRSQTTALAEKLRRSEDADVLVQARLRLTTCLRLNTCPSGGWRMIDLGETSDPGEASIRDRVEALAGAVDLRGKALDALASAYDAFQMDAEHDAGAELATQVSSAVTSVGRYGGAVAALTGGGAGAAAAVAAPAAALVARLAAERGQSRRLATASHILGEAAGSLAQSLRAEREAFVVTQAYVASKTQALDDALLEDGVLSPTAALQSAGLVAASAAAPDADRAIANHPALAGAIRRVLEERRSSDAAAASRGYDIALFALAQLQQQHRAFEAGQAGAVDRLNAAVGDLETASSALAPSKK